MCRRPEDLQARRAEGMIALPLDLGDEASVAACAEAALAHGPIDALVNNAAFALPGAVEEDGGGRAALGPPLSRGEKDGLRLQIEACWNIGSLSREAQRTAVSVQFSMSTDGMPDADSVRMIASEGGSDAAAGQAFEAAAVDFMATLRQGEETVKAGLAGRAEPQAVVEALAATELAVQTAISIRDRVV